MLFPPALPAVLELVDACPATQFVLDHLGKPEITRWRLGAVGVAGSGAFEAAERGREAFRTRDRGGPHARWTPGDLQPYVEHALETFGPDRLLYGSDWPVVERAGGHARWLEAVENLLAGLSVSERSAILAENAERTYFG